MRRMAIPSDPYTFTDGPGNTASGEQVNERFDPLYAALNGGLEGDNFSTALAEQLGVSSGATVRSGKSIIDAEGTRTNAAYGALTNGPDAVTVEVPTGGRLFIGFEALWKESVSGSARAAIFIGANQLKIPYGTNVDLQAARVDGLSAGNYRRVTAAGPGLVSQALGVAAAASVGTGQVVGHWGAWGMELGTTYVSGGTAEPITPGLCIVRVDPGTYSVSVQWKASGGATVSAKERKLWVEARA